MVNAYDKLGRDLHYEISASEVAAILGVSHGHVTQIMRAGLLPARQLPSGDWLTTRSMLGAYDETARRGRGRGLSAAAAWGVLWELSGLRATWLSKGTLSRLRQQLASWSAEDIVRAVSARTRATRFHDAPDKFASELSLSGRAVAGSLNVGVISRPSTPVGYPRWDTVESLARRHRMHADYRGDVVLLENTLPIAYEETQMPPAVIAADLACSTWPAERTRGRAALDDLWDDWAGSYGALFASRAGSRARSR